MATLKGQNLRLLRKTGANYEVFALATTCSITLTGNTEEASTKDDIGGASSPEIVSKSWSANVSSLNVLDVSAMLTAIKSGEPIDIMFDETSTTDNKTGLATTFARVGKAFINDATFTFNDRENSAKSLQFTGTGELKRVEAETTAPAAAGGYGKGQFVRLFLGNDNTAVPSKVIAAAKSLSFHVSVELENSTTKDTTGDWQEQSFVGISYDISTSALVRSGDVVTSSTQAQGLSQFEEIYEASSPVRWQIANVSGANNRTKGSVIASGSVVVTSLNINATNRQAATYDATLQGYGAYEV